MQHDVTLPIHVPEQIALYQTDQLLTQEVCTFDPAAVPHMLREPREVLAIDIGGDKLRSARYRVDRGDLQITDESTFQSRGGTGYLKILESLAENARNGGIPVGISVAIKMNGSRVGRTVNLPVLFDELAAQYDGDFANLFREQAFVANDTITGVCGSTGRLAMQGRTVDAAAFVICASGMGGAILRNGMATHVEIGHAPVVPDLNPLGQTTHCGVEGRTYVCVERVTAARAGIEDLYEQLTGDHADGVTLGQRYERRDELATTLYQTSARALAHAIAGVHDRYNFEQAIHSVTVLHGGNFEIARYRDDVERVLYHLPSVTSSIAYSRDLARNVCLDGAAFLAMYKH